MRSSTKKQRAPGKKGWQKKRLFFIFIFILFLVVVSLGTRYVRSFQDLQNKSSWAVNLRNASQIAGTNYLLYGLVENNGAADIEEMFFLNYSPEGTSCNIVFIPGKILMHRLEENEEPSRAQTEGKLQKVGSKMGALRMKLLKRTPFFLSIPPAIFIMRRRSTIKVARFECSCSSFHRN